MAKEDRGKITLDGIKLSAKITVSTHTSSNTIVSFQFLSFFICLRFKIIAEKFTYKTHFSLIGELSFGKRFEW
jgi:hypothetical protein